MNLAGEVAVKNKKERDRNLQENILVVPNTAAVQKNTNFHGFRPGTDHNLWTQFAAEGLFLDRDIVEDDTRYKQLIVYLVLRCRQEIFIYQRIRETGEKRLLDMYSFGLGGHINPVHSHSFRRLITSNLTRELKEEVSFKGQYSYRFLGFLNDQEEEVGRYHFGLVFLVSCLSPHISVREKNKIQGKLVPVSRLVEYQDNLENWSLILLPYIPDLVGMCTGDSPSCTR
ncbi:MAG TPA: hypothetical protein GXX59_09895 [Syntrophomonadaceae bacterium]|nr:hypothetical protein [Syntrophomonadaceae bacterium]